MPSERKPKGHEPQSYGSNEEWLHGNTSQSVNGTQERADRPNDPSFYEPAHREPAPPSRDGAPDDSTTRGAEGATMDDGGSASFKVSTDSDQRKSFFRDRDYK